MVEHKLEYYYTDIKYALLNMELKQISGLKAKNIKRSPADISFFRIETQRASSCKVF